MNVLHCVRAPVSEDLERSDADLSLKPLAEGDVLGGKYVLLHPLGTGGMGQVWMARNSSTGAEVAVKTLLPELASSRAALARFQDEARAMSQLAHRGIVRIFDLVELEGDAGRPVIVMEVLRGHTLAQRIAEQGPLTVPETLAVVLPLLSALSHAHGAGIVHRDVKPDNVFLACEPDGDVVPKLLDFGISQVREWGVTGERGQRWVGTPWYMSPEQARGEEVDARTDIFGVGLLLYECLSGNNPFRGDGNNGTAPPCRIPIPIPGVRARLWRAIARALATHPDDRFASAEALAEALLAAKPGPRPWSSWSATTSAWPELSRGAFFSSLFCAASLVVILLATIFAHR